MIFLLFPLVENANNVSTLFPIASNSLEKILSNPKSLPIAVRLLELVPKAIAGNGDLSVENLAINSAAKCCESQNFLHFLQIKFYPHFLKNFLQNQWIIQSYLKELYHHI